MFSLLPEFEGELTIDPLPEDAMVRIRARVDAGLLQPGMRVRANYQVRSADRDSIRFGAEGFLTAYNVGLNEVHVWRIGRSQLGYQVSFWRWTWTAVAHGLLLGLVFVLLAILVPQVRRDVASYPGGWFLAAGMVGFWCLVWPWLLAALHRRPAERLLQRILREAMTGSSARAA